MDYENTMNMTTDDWEYNLARSWESHILHIEEAAWLSLQEDD